MSAISDCLNLLQIQGMEKLIVFHADHYCMLRVIRSFFRFSSKSKLLKSVHNRMQLIMFRQQLITILSQELSSVEGIHDIWKQTGRPCIPRLLCSFQQVCNATETTSMIRH